VLREQPVMAKYSQLPGFGGSVLAAARFGEVVATEGLFTALDRRPA